MDHWFLSGGISGLAQVITQDFDALEADFKRFYGEDLRMVCWGENPWTVRRVLTHVKHLPPDSALVRKRDGDFAGWSNDTEMLAAVVDLLQSLISVTVKVGGGEAPEPTPVPRPYAVEPRKSAEKVISASELTSFF